MLIIIHALYMYFIIHQYTFPYTLCIRVHYTFLIQAISCSVFFLMGRYYKTLNDWPYGKLGSSLTWQFPSASPLVILKGTGKQTYKAT